MKLLIGSFLGVTLGVAAPAWAGTGKLALTGGVSTIDGAAGGGISPWAVIGTQATEGEVGVAINASALPTKDYSHRSVSAIVGLYNRVELSSASKASTPRRPRHSTGSAFRCSRASTFA